MVEKIRLGTSERKVNKMSEIALYIGPAALFEQTAEECVELSKACLKMSRILRGENPTPMTEDEARDMIIEELCDVLTCVNEILDSNDDINMSEIESRMIVKKARWEARLEEAKGMDACETCKIKW